MMTLGLLRLGLPWDVLERMPAGDAVAYYECAVAAAQVAEEQAREAAWFQRQGGGGGG